ncbi:hypothetical protein TSMEX_011127 [Taenia solium]|eukprot:TsM_001192800 transcript=TsM_001192800 gene=TsM_001192800
MTFVSVLSVFGSNGAENKSDKFQKLFYDGLVAALGIYASDVDAVVATSAPMPALTETKKSSELINFGNRFMNLGIKLAVYFYLSN